MAKNSLESWRKKGIAERFFINDGMNAKSIALELDVSEVTISKWRNEGKWDDRRQMALAAPHRIKELLLGELEKISNGQQSMIDADALAKISKVIESVDKRVNVQIVISVIKEFDNWMATQEPELAVKFLDFHKRFILYKARQDA